MKVLDKRSIIENDEIDHTIAEKNILQNLVHPFLVHLYYSFQSLEHLFFVMDYINGGELFYHLQKERKFVPQRVKFYCSEICTALEYLHSNGIIYRDLKPENILLNSDGHVCLTDFGISKQGLFTDEAKAMTFCGTAEYLAPEVLEGKGYTKAVDWWAFGVLMYEMLVGNAPFYSPNIQQMYVKIQTARLEFPESFDAATKSLLSQLLERDPQKRLADPVLIKKHEYWNNFDWEKSVQKELTPPFIPPVKSELDVSQIDPMFTREKVTLADLTTQSASVSPSSSSPLQIDQKAFEDFSFFSETEK